MKLTTTARRTAVGAAALALVCAGNGVANAATWTVGHPPFSTVSGVPYAPLAGVSATSASDVWAVGRDDGASLTEHWNGHAWSSVALPAGPCDLFESDCQLTGVSADSPTDAVAVGTALLPTNGWVLAPLAYQWTGTAWRTMPLSSDITYSSLAHVKTFSATNAWAVGTGFSGTQTVATAAHWDGTSWTQQTTPFATPLGLTMNAIAGSSPSDIWIVGKSSSSGYHNRVTHSVILHYDGTAWSTVAIPDTGGLADIAALSPADAWALGTDGHVLHWDGTAWTINAQFNGGAALVAASATNVWVAGIYVNSTLAVAHYNGSAWTTATAPSGIDKVTAGAALSTGAVWFAGLQWPPNGTTVPAVLSTTG